MKIIALDLGSNMALAHNGMDVAICDHLVATGPRAHRAGAIMGWLDLRFRQIERACSIDLVVYERPFARGFDATRCGWGLAGIVEALATKYSWAVTDQTPQSIKKFAIGGRARVKMTSAERRKAAADEKQLMIEAARRMGYTGHNEHEADAFCLLKYAEAHAVILPKGTL